MKDGFGVYRFKSSAVYTGCFKNNVYQGQGLYQHAGGAVFDGEYRSGERDGFGILYSKDGKVLFQGMWKEGKRVHLSGTSPVSSVVSAVLSPASPPGTPVPSAAKRCEEMYSTSDEIES